jgi:hypothetical protein
MGTNFFLRRCVESMGFLNRTLYTKILFLEEFLTVNVPEAIRKMNVLPWHSISEMVTVFF